MLQKLCGGAIAGTTATAILSRANQSGTNSLGKSESGDYLSSSSRTEKSSQFNYWLLGVGIALFKKNPEVRDTVPNLEHIERVLRNGRHLLRLINDALEMSRYSAGKIELHPEPIDVRSLINDVFEMLKPLADAKELQIISDCESAPEKVLADPLRLQQVVTNLLSNAIRYTESGTVQLTCQMRSDNQWSIAIADTGIGIAPEDQPYIFEPFFRADNGGTYLPDSTGLGLAIVLQLIKLMRGKIELVSQVEVGSTFTVILPLEVKTIELST